VPTSYCGRTTRRGTLYEDESPEDEEVHTGEYSSGEELRGDVPEVHLLHKEGHQHRIEDDICDREQQMERQLDVHLVERMIAERPEFLEYETGCEPSQERDDG
jgi:hypothetical protein